MYDLCFKLLYFLCSMAVVSISANTSLWPGGGRVHSSQTSRGEQDVRGEKCVCGGGGDSFINSKDWKKI